MYDSEALYQDADLEMAEMAAVGDRIAALRKQGVCTHQGWVGYAGGKVYYPEQEGLKKGQVACRDGCGKKFASEEALLAEQEELLED